MKRAVFILILFGLLGSGALFYIKKRAADVLATAPVAQVQRKLPTTRPRTAPAPLPLTYIDAVRAANPNIPATQPLAVPVDLSDAAHIILHDPIYLDPLGNLWITRADAAPTAQILKHAADPPEHLIPDHAVFVHWNIDDNGEWSASVIARRPAGDLEIISSTDRQPFPGSHAYRWSDAFSWQNKIVVPSDFGVSVFELQPRIVEFFHPLPGVAKGSNPPLAILDSRGVLAWAPWEHGHAGSNGTSRFVDGKWVDLATDPWGQRPIHLLPLLDGSILQILAGDSDTVSLVIAPLETADIDLPRVTDLVHDLADADDQKRESAFTELSRYGPGVAALLENLSHDQSPESRLRIKQLLRGKLAPALGGMDLIDHRMLTVGRQPDGAVLFFAPAGVALPNSKNQPQTQSPAWLCIRPGGRVERPLQARLIVDQNPLACTLQPVRDEWVICDSAGVRQFTGDGFTSLVRPEERDFSHLVGLDRRGRWLLSGPHDASEKTTTLLIDPTILDPSPRLPAWNMTISNGLVGWNKENFPVIKRGGAWALKAEGWEPLPDSDPLVTELPPAKPNDTPATRPATTQNNPSNPPLLTAPDGTRYFDGKTTLIIISRSGRRISWPLPPTATGSIDPTLLRTADGTLFLFNQPGRVLRLTENDAAPEPFQVRATFTKDIPNIAPTRIWLDPLERIDWVYNGNQLSVMFPRGQIPRQISRMMPE